MAPVLAARHINGFEPPPSSILATHVVNGNGVPDLDRDNFNQLLAEVLSTDEQGHSNLGADVSVNHRLIGIIFQVGIEPALEEDPFRATSSTGKADAQLQTCLEAIQLAVERSPQVLFVKSDPNGRAGPQQSPPLYQWLILRLLPFIVPSQKAEIQDGVLAVIETMLTAYMKCTPLSSCSGLLAFIRSAISGKKHFPADNR